jgi:glutaredoxin 3
MPIRIFSTPVCKACKVAKEYFNKIGKKFEEIDVTNPVHLAEMMNISGSMSVPIITIGNHVIEGFNKKRIDELTK